MRATGLAVLLVVALPARAPAQTSPAASKSVPRGTRSHYGTNFGNRYQYFGLGYGYGPGSFGPGGWSAFGGGGGYGGYGAYSHRGSRYGRYGGYGLYDQQAENLHEQQMMWSMNFAPLPQTAPGVTVNPLWNPYQSRLRDDVFHRAERAPVPEEYENPFVRDPSLRPSPTSPTGPTGSSQGQKPAANHPWRGRVVPPRPAAAVGLDCSAPVAALPALRSPTPPPD